MRILFSEGSSTSARQSLFALGPLGYAIDLCDPQRLALGRFSRYARSWHRCPSFARQPRAYLDFVRGLLQQEHYDVLLAVHDQVLLLARYRDELARLTGLAVPDFEAVRTIQSKVRFIELLDGLKLPQPGFRILESIREWESQRDFPCFVKREISTAGRGVWRVESPQQLRDLAQQWSSTPNAASEGKVIVQQEALGSYCVVQAVFQHGQLLAAHCYTQRARGVGGSAHARESVHHPAVVADVALLGRNLTWHGALHMEYFFDATTGKVQYIEANPRIGETVNATQAGLNLCDLLVQVSLNQCLTPLPPARAGVRTHSLMMSLLGLAERGECRRRLVQEMIHAWRGTGVYENSRDELTSLDEDPLTLIPLVAVASRLLLRPQLADSIIHGAVEYYSLDEAAMKRLLDLTLHELPAHGYRGLPR